MDRHPWRVFLSHTSELRHMPEGKSFVAAAENGVKLLGHAPVDMVYFPAGDDDPAGTCRDQVAVCQVYVGIIGFRYGTPVRGLPDVSYTELEFDTATALGMPRLVFLLDAERTVGERRWLVDERHGARQEAFRRRLQDAEGLTVKTVASPGDLETALVHALGAIRDPRALRLPTSHPAAVGPVWWVPELADLVVPRPELAAQLAGLLTGAVVGQAGSLAVHGGGGFGKTTLANMVCLRDDVKEHFHDGTLWVQLGQDIADARLAEVINGLSARLGAQHPGPSDPMQAGMRFGEQLADRRMLVVIDDVWSADQLTPFLQGGPRCRRLITTRDRRTLPLNCPTLSVAVMEPDQAVMLLTETVPALGADTAGALATRCGHWPVLLRLVAGHLYTRITAGMSVNAALAEVAQGLDEAGVAAFDDAGRARAVATTIEASLRLLREPGATDGGPLARYLELAVFAEDTAIPRGVLETLWRHSAGWRSWQTQRFCDRLADLALVQAVDGPSPGLRLHHVVHQYIREQVGAGLPAMHRRLVDACREGLPTEDGRTAWWVLPVADTYLWSNLAVHLAESADQEGLVALAHDLRWAAAKIHVVGPVSVEADLTLLPVDPVAQALKRLVRQTGHLHLPDDSRATAAATLAAYAVGVDALLPSATELVEHLPSPFLRPAAPLPDQPDPALDRTLTGHVKMVAALAVASDGSWLASGGGGDVGGGGDGTVRIWLPTLGTERAVLPGHPGGVSALVVVPPDGRWLASAGRDGAVRLWEVATGAVRGMRPGHPDRVSALVVSPDSSWLASGGLDGTVRVWDPATGTQRLLLTGHTGWVSALVVAPDSSWLASAGGDGTVRVWDPATGTQRLLLTGHTGWVSALVVAPDSSWLASAGGDRTVRRWDPATGAPLGVLAGHFGPVSALAVAPDSSWLASGGGDGSVRVWDVATGTARFVLAGHSGPVLALAVTPGGDCLASAGRDGTVQVWDAGAGVQRAVLSGHTRNAAALAVAPDGTWLASGGGDGTVRIWDPTAGEVEHAGRTHGVGVLAVPPDGAWLAAASWDGTVRLHDPATGAERAVLRGHTGRVSALVVAPDSSWLASADEDGRAWVWDPHTGAGRAVLDGHTGLVSALAAAPDSSWLASGGIDATVRVWDPLTGQRLADADGLAGRVSALVVAPNSSWLASAGIDATIEVWYPERILAGAPSGGPVLTGHTSRVSALVVAPDSSWLASGGVDATVRIWDPAGGGQRVLLRGHTDGVLALAVAPDGSWLASAGRDGTVRVWDPAGGTAPVVLTGHRGDNLKRF